jgi:lipid-binding SYLF domain-containing protein
LAWPEHIALCSLRILDHNSAMKKIIVSLITMFLATSAFSKDKADLDNIVRKITAKFDAMQSNPGKAIPAETLSKAKGIILMDRTKGGFIFAYQGGGGVAMVRDTATQKWSAPAFLTASEASLGFQIGGQQSFVVILLMTTNATRMITNGEIEFGGEASGTAGDTSTGVEGSVKTTPSVLVYDDRKGLYGGAAVKGGAISSDENANILYYGQYVTLEEILFKNKFKASEVATTLADKIETAGQRRK